MTKCERCGVKPIGEYELHDYCNACSKNLCASCMKGGSCRESADRKHQPAEHGADAS